MLAVAGTVRQLTSYLFAEANTLTAPVYPTGGLRLAAELGQSYAQASSLQARDAVSQQVYANPSRAYQQARLGLEGYRALSARATLQLQLQAGLSWHNQQVVANDYVLGGLTPVFRNQLTFAGLPEGGLFASSAVVALVGCRYALTPRLLALAKANVAGHDFIASNQRLQAAGTTYGAALGLGLKSPVGPIEANLMYSGLLGRLVPYFNIGIPFGYQ